MAIKARAPSEIQMLFDGRRTLPQLLHLKDKLRREESVDLHLIGVLCGILHGNYAKDPADSRSLSISMPNTFSMSPGYIRKYVRKHALRKYPFDVFDKLRDRLEFLHRKPGPEVNGTWAQADCRQLKGVVDASSVSLIVTSPPYLRVVRYGKYNWIRLWFLGESVKKIDKRLSVEETDNRLRLSDQLRLPSYLKFMTEAIRCWEGLLRPGGVCVIVVGDVDSGEFGQLNLAAEILKDLRIETSLQLVDVIEDRIEVGGKVTRIWGSRRGNATRVERILVLKKPGARRRRTRKPADVLAELRAVN